MSEVHRIQLKALVKGMYDLQEIRKQQGIRIVQSWKIKLGQEPGHKEEELDAEAKEILKDLRTEWKRLTDGYIKNRTRVKITDEVVQDTFLSMTELALIQNYEVALEQEHNHVSSLKDLLVYFPIYTRWLTHVRGCGDMMSAVIVSHFSPAKAPYVSSFWKYAGLDVVDVDGQGQGKRKLKAHMHDEIYLDKDGNEQTKKTLGHSPWFQSKLLEVLGGNMIKAGSRYRRQVYDSYKRRLEHHEKYGIDTETSRGHRHRMAQRWMVKVFIKDLWLHWRGLEGLPTEPDYAESKIGKRGHAPVVPLDGPDDDPNEETDEEIERMLAEA